jgi:hypothetical protein
MQSWGRSPALRRRSASAVAPFEDLYVGDVAAWRSSSHLWGIAHMEGMPIPMDVEAYRPAAEGGLGVTTVESHPTPR